VLAKTPGLLPAITRGEKILSEITPDALGAA
jgi:hypothetical protein